MSTRKTGEIPHNSPEQIEDYLRSALELVERLEVPDDLRVAAFTKAVDLFASKQLLLEQAPPLGVGGMEIPGLRARH